MPDPPWPQVLTAMWRQATRRPCGCHADPIVFGHICGWHR